MNDMSSVIIPKSDQINSDDLIGSTMTVTIRGVKIAGNQEQPVSVQLEGMEKVYRPCKIMCRLMVRMWGDDAKTYTGKSMTLYRDPSVKWGALTVGGIRISHMSHIDGEQVVVLQEKRGQLKPHTIRPLVVDQQRPPADDLGTWAHKFIAAVGRAPSLDKLNAYAATVTDKLTALEVEIPEAHGACLTALADKRASFASDDDSDPFAEQTGED